MFSLVAVMCFYLGTKNFFDAFATPFSVWTTVNWLLFLTGGGLIIICYFCVRQAMKDFEEAKQKKEAQASVDEEE